MLPCASSTATTGEGEMGEPLIVLPGWPMNARCVAAPGGERAAASGSSTTKLIE